MSILKKCLAALTLLFVIASTALLVLSKSINPDVVRTFVSEQLASMTSQPSHINGNLSWHIFPAPGISLTNIVLGNEDSQTGYLLEMDTLHLNLKIASLLQGKLVFNDVKVNGFHVQINTDIASAKSEAITPSKSSSSVDEQFAVENLLLTDGVMIIHQHENTLTMNHLQIGAEHINLKGEMFPFQLKANMVYTKDKLVLAKSHAQFKGGILLPGALPGTPFAQGKTPVIKGQLLLDNAQVGQIKLNKVKAYTLLKQGILQLNPMNITLYQGRSIGDLRYELAEKNLQINQTGSDINSAKLSQDLFGKVLVKGKLDISLHTQADLSRATWQDSLLGNGNLSIKDGSLESIDLNKLVSITSGKLDKMLGELRTGLKLNDKPDNPLKEPVFLTGSTPFTLLSLPWRVDNGSMHSESMLLDAGMLQLKGNARLSLNDYALNGQLSAVINTPDGKIATIQQMLGGHFPLLVKNTLIDPQVLPDYAKINPVLSKAWLNNTLGKPVRTITDTVFSIMPR